MNLVFFEGFFCDLSPPQQQPNTNNSVALVSCYMAYISSSELRQERKLYRSSCREAKQFDTDYIVADYPRSHPCNINRRVREDENMV